MSGRGHRIGTLLLFLPLLLGPACGRLPDGDYDVIISGGRLLDGTGNPWYRADLGLKDGRIAAIGRLVGCRAEVEIDAAGLVVAPGFIDAHSHSDYTLLVDGRGMSKVHQGVTTEILGESASVAPQKEEEGDNGNYETIRGSGHQVRVDWTDLSGYFRRLTDEGVSVNIGTYVGSGQVRAYVMGNENRDPTPREQAAMEGLTARAMQQGALGLAAGLIYVPDRYQSTDELTGLARVASGYDGLFAVHLRNEGRRIRRAILEVAQVGVGADLPVHIFHLKVSGRESWGRMAEICGLIDSLRASGLDINADVYPYTAGATTLNILLPPWSREGGADEITARLEDPVLQARIINELEKKGPNWDDAFAGWNRVMIASVQTEKNKEWEGKTLQDLARGWRLAPETALVRLIREEKAWASGVFFAMDEADVGTAMAAPWISFSSDGRAVSPKGPLGMSHPHPRYYGAFPRILGRYVRESGVLGLAEAVRKMTGWTAVSHGITDRGFLLPGLAADITIFDPEKVADRATFQDPHRYPVGIEYVLVNGQVVVDRGRHTGALPGRIVYGAGLERGRERP